MIIGDLISVDDEVWQFFLTFIEIIDILLSYTLTRDMVNHLNNLIEIHNSDYVKYFQDTLKPKHHILIHYPTIILKSGPPRHYWCFRYEAKHKEFKMYARAITSRRNICLTLANKHQFKFAYFLLKQKENSFLVEALEKHKIDSKHMTIIFNFMNVSTNNYFSYSKIQFRGTTYKIGNFLTCCHNEICLFEILEIILLKKNTVYFVVQQILLELFDTHFRAYKVDMNKSVMNIDQFNCPPININKVTGGNLMIRLKEYF